MSIKKCNYKNLKIVIINDSPQKLKKHLKYHQIFTCYPEVQHWTYAFKLALKNVTNKTDFFFIMHDDDQIVPDYINKCISALLKNRKLIAVSSSLKTIDSQGKKISSIQFKYSKQVLSGRDNVLLHYCESCVAFPAVFYRNLKIDYAPLIERKFGSFADGLFLAELATHGDIEIIPQALYKYRLHSGQMSVIQSAKAEFFFLRELVRRSSHALRSTIYGKVIHRATLACLNDMRRNRNLDSLYQLYKAGLVISWKTAFNKPKLLLRAGLAVLLRPKSWRRSEAAIILEHESKIKESLSVICFSKDRPMQLSALLQSLQAQARIPCQIQVIYRASNSENACAYRALQQENPKCQLIEEDDFQSQVNQLLINTGRFVCFATDDSVFFQSFDLEGVLDDPRVMCFSLRLGMNSQYCYTSDRAMPAPKFYCNESCLLWAWPDASDDYAYPMSLDGHIFRKSTLIPIMRSLEFRNPNELEDQLAKRVLQPEVLRESPRWMASYRNSRYVSIPINRIQNTFKNRVGQDPRYSPTKLLMRYQRGERIDVEKTVLTPPIGAHQEYRLAFVSGSAFRKRSPKKRRV